MAAAGRSEAADVWMLQDPFEEWLSAAAVLGGKDNDPGTVLVWRSPSGLAQHAAVTIGGGYALHKPSQRLDEPAESPHRQGSHRQRPADWTSVSPIHTDRRVGLPCRGDFKFPVGLPMAKETVLSNNPCPVPEQPPNDLGRTL